MTKDEALRLALEALEADELAMIQDKDGHMVYLKDQAITTIKAALEAKDEPVACAECGIGGGYALYCVACAEKFFGNKEWVGLTEDEMFDCLVKFDPVAKRLPLGFKWFAEAIEAKLKEKNET